MISEEKPLNQYLPAAVTDGWNMKKKVFLYGDLSYSLKKLRLIITFIFD